MVPATSQPYSNKLSLREEAPYVSGVITQLKDTASEKRSCGERVIAVSLPAEEGTDYW